MTERASGSGPAAGARTGKRTDADAAGAGARGVDLGGRGIAQIKVSPLVSSTYLYERCLKHV